MKKLILLTIYFLIITSIFALYSFKNNSKADSKGYLPLEIIDSYITGDTLIIVSTSDYLFYPFNKASDIEGMNTGVKFEIKPLADDIYLLNHKSSFIKLIASEETTFLEIVKANITDEGVLLNDHISINMPRSGFFDYFRLQNDSTINVVQMVSGLDGVWHYYTFKNNVLEHIEIKSDYVIL